MNKGEGREPKTLEITKLFFYNAENHYCLKFKYIHIAYHCYLKVVNYILIFLIIKGTV